MRHVLLLLTLVLSAASLAARAGVPATTAIEPGLVLDGKRILHVGAHPDDEWIFAPMMAEACRFNGATCHLVVAQDAESWGCLMTIGLKDRYRCSQIRRYETAASAANLNASHEFYGWREGIYNWNDAGVRSNLAALAAEADGHANLVARFRRTLDEFRPDVVLAFDPRHGTTCHPNHRAVVSLLLEAIDGLPEPRRPEVWLGSDYGVPGAPPEIASITDDYGLVRWPDDPAPVTWYDMTRALPDGRTAYDYLVDALRLNATQFNDVATGRRMPSPAPEHRRLPLVNLRDIDPREPGLCEDRAPPMFHQLESMSEADLVRAATGG